MTVAIDTATVASLATAAGTVVLAVATFSAVRSSNRSARVAKAALQDQRRPVLAQSRLDDPKQMIMFLRGRWLSAEGGRAAAELTDGVVDLAISLRNVGSGIAVCQGWTVFTADEVATRTGHTRLEDYRLQARDLYIPAGDIGMSQGALRNSRPCGTDGLKFRSERRSASTRASAGGRQAHDETDNLGLIANCSLFCPGSTRLARLCRD